MPLRRNTKQIFITIDNQPLVCEMCGADITSDVAFSIFTEYPMPGSGQPGQRCTVTQHFYCSHLHAVAGTLVCLLFHIEEDTTHNTVPPGIQLPDGTAIAQAISALKTLLQKYAG